jgi:hypothetical protein
MAGCASAALTGFPSFNLLWQSANPALAKAQAKAPVVLAADPSESASQLAPWRVEGAHP